MNEKYADICGWKGHENRIEAIQYAAGSRQDGASVLDARITFHKTLDKVAPDSTDGHRQNQQHKRAGRPAFGRNRREQTNADDRGSQAAEDPAPGLTGADIRR